MRVPDADTDPRTEVGQVGAALNRMLGHVADALAARQASETRVRQFVADASHELRTPLAAIRGYAELARRGRDAVPPDVAHALRRVESESARMTTLVDDLLLLARLDSGRPLAAEPVDLTALVVDAVSDAHVAGPDHRWQLDLPDERVTVPGDAARLHQVLANLLANARVHTPPGTHGDHQAGPVDGGGRAHRRRRRARHPGRAAAGGLRAVRPRRQLPVPGARQHRPRPGHRRRRGGGPPRHGRGGEPAGPHRLHRPAAGHRRRPPMTPRPDATATGGRFHSRRIGRSRGGPAGRPRLAAMDRTESLLTDARDPVAHPATHRRRRPRPPRPSPQHVRVDGDRPPPEPAPADPRWARPALLALLLATGLLYLWGLGASGWANSFYSAAVQAGSESWKAFFFGSSDAANSITVDKTPGVAVADGPVGAGLRAEQLGRSWCRRRCCGVASVGVLYATVRRWYGPAAGLLAGAVLALTPVATLMFRFNNPDALLVLLLVAGAYATVRAVETASTRWLVLVGALVGFGFLTKMLQAFLVVPVFAGVYLLAAPTGLWRRVRQLLLAGLARGGRRRLVGGGRRAGARPAPGPYIGGSQNNSILELTLGYNGLGRITGDEEGSVGGGAGRAAAVAVLRADRLAADVRHRDRRPDLLAAAGRADPAGRRPGAGGPGGADRPAAGRAAALGRLAAGHRADLQLHAGIFHAYYTVALAPAVGALVGIGTVLLWRERRPRALPAAGRGAGRPVAAPVAGGSGRAALPPRTSADPAARPARGGARWPPPPPWPSPSRSPPGGRGGCSAAAPTSTRGCAPPCWSSGWPRPC